MPDYVRVATFEADDAARDALVRQISESEGPPPEVPAKGIIVLTDRESGALRVVVRFGSEDDLRRGSAALDAMSPSDLGGEIRRVSVETFEVLLDRQA